ncbi:MAG: pyruvate kinase, partial [Nanoarchaeota archaeon]|nr:pyruvate kinase [Nanoarchaeota archaeon]
GDIELKVIEKNEEELICKVSNSGIIKSRKSVNIPGIHLSLPSLSEKDRTYISFAIEQDVDFIAHSFIRNKEDLKEIQKLLDEHNSKIKIIAKIENQEGVDNIDEILENCYGIMIARGDLGIEIYTEKIPMIQKNIINKCIFAKKPVIVATQMLHSMTKHPRPTRAEVSDIANAIYDGTDAIMLSGETAHGDYPIKAVEMMAKVALEVEKNIPAMNLISENNINDEVPAFIVKSAIRSTLKLPIKAIVTDTETGRTGRYLSAFRAKKLIYSQCYSERVVRELALSYGIYPEFMVKKERTSEFLKEAVSALLEKGYFDKSDLIAVVGGNFGPNHGASFLEISTAEKIVDGE